MKRMKKLMHIVKFDEIRLQRKHQRDLGLSVPENYFENSKKEIINLTTQNNRKRAGKLIRLKVIWFAAASVVLLLSIGFLTKYYFNSQTSIFQIVSDTLKPETKEFLTFDVSNESQYETLISSLFIEDEGIDAFLDEAFMDDVIQYLE